MVQVRAGRDLCGSVSGPQETAGDYLGERQELTGRMRGSWCGVAVR